MVFCDGCNMCVHQACYGIEKIPQGNWLCAPCQFGGNTFKPQCVLCPNLGGALKSTRNLRHWCHVSCALWIPETGFANPDKMEPIVNLNQVTPDRWQLTCQLCKEKKGCCLQCSERRCHAAFHVTCAFKHNLEMQTVLDNTDILFNAYCFKHSRKRQMQRENNEDDEEEEEEEEEDTEEDAEEEEEKQTKIESEDTDLNLNSSSVDQNK
jgi:protein Jade-3